MVATVALMIDVEKTIREYLPNIIHMSLATCAGEKPWVCEVHYAYDEKLNLYWMSLESTRHSQEISKNPNVAGNIVTQHKQGEKPRGVYFEGRAELLTDVDEHHPAYVAYKERFGINKEDLTEAKTADGNKFYQVSVSKWYVFDTREAHGKFELEWNR